MRPVLAVMAGLLPLVAGCGALPLAPQAAAPAPATAPPAATVPTDAQAARLAPPGPREDSAASIPAASSMQKSEYEEHTLTVGRDELRMSLPCTPKAGDPDKDQTELGALKLAPYECDYDAASLAFTILATRFERPLAKTALGSERDAKSASIARIVAREACQGFKASGVTCKVGTPLLVDGVASVDVKIVGPAPIALEVQARYPYAVGVIVAGAEGASAATSKALASLRLPE
ncbi:MAG TPA: hypothetical protein VGG39_16655 [Polyangiaceae bacterium]|jgi:hypothetical protein